MAGAKYGVGKVLASYGFHLAALDGELLATLVAIGGYLSIGKGGAQDNLLDDFCGLGKEFRQGAECYVGVVAVDINVEIGTIVVQSLGNLLRGHIQAAFSQHVGRSRSGEGVALSYRACMKDKRYTHNLILWTVNRIYRSAVRGGMLYCFGHCYRSRYCEWWLSHFAAL